MNPGAGLLGGSDHKLMIFLGKLFKNDLGKLQNLFDQVFGYMIGQSRQIVGLAPKDEKVEKVFIEIERSDHNEKVKPTKKY